MPFLYIIFQEKLASQLQPSQIPPFSIKNSISTNRNIQILGHKRRRRINRNPDNLITRLLEIRIRANQPLSRKRKPTNSNFHFLSLPYRSNRETTPNRRRERVGGIKSVYLKNRWSPWRRRKEPIAAARASIRTESRKSNVPSPLPVQV